MKKRFRSHNLFRCKFLNKNAQAAMEFMMTYGWAIMALAISIAALSYFTSYSNKEDYSNSCIVPTGFFCKEFYIGSNGLSLVLLNSLGKDINNVVISVDSLNKGSCGISNSFNLIDGAMGTFTLSCSNLETKKPVIAKFKIDYNSVSGLTYSSRGELKYKISSTNITLNPNTTTQCSDSTPLSQCSSTKPKYCTSNGSLIDDCFQCGCSLGSTCLANNSCTPPPPPPTGPTWSNPLAYQSGVGPHVFLMNWSSAGNLNTYILSLYRDINGANSISNSSPSSDWNNPNYGSKGYTTNFSVAVTSFLGYQDINNLGYWRFYANDNYGWSESDIQIHNFSLEDSSSPSFVSQSINPTTLCQGDIIFTSSWTDDMNLHYIILSMNYSSSGFVNDTPITVYGTSNSSDIIKSLYLPSNTNVSWKYYAYDVAGKMGISGTYSQRIGPAMCP